jgi:hypothetical protein
MVEGFDPPANVAGKTFDDSGLAASCPQQRGATNSEVKRTQVRITDRFIDGLICRRMEEKKDGGKGNDAPGAPKRSGDPPRVSNRRLRPHASTQYTRLNWGSA